MAQAKGSEHQTSLIEEATFNVTPATPAFLTQRLTGNTLELNKSALISQELRPDRQLAGVRHGNRSSAGDLSFELSGGAQDILLEAVMGGSWAANVLKNGVVDRSFTIERYFSDIGDYLRYTGSFINSFQLSVVPDAIVSGSFGVVGAGMVTDTLPITGAAYTAAPTREVFDSFNGTINEGGAPIAVVTGIELSLDNSDEAGFVVGSADARAINPGQANISGTVSAWFEDLTLIDKFVSETLTSMDFTLAYLGNSYLFEIPAMKYMGSSAPVSDASGVILSMPFQAIYDATEATTLKITRVLV